VKKSARVIIEKYYSRLTLDFQTNKRICDEVAIIPSKRLRNKIAGFVTVRFVLRVGAGVEQPTGPECRIAAVSLHRMRIVRQLCRSIALLFAPAWLGVLTWMLCCRGIACLVSLVGSCCVFFFCGAPLCARFPPPQHLMARIQKGPVRGISLKLQEEERERRMDFVPEVSAVDTGMIEIDADTKKMLEALGMGNLPHVVVQTTPVEVRGRAPGGVAYNRDRR